MSKKKVEKDRSHLDIILTALENKKAEDIVIYNMKDIVDYTEHFVFCSGTSSTHVGALADEVYRALRKEKVHSKESGDKKSGWIVIDSGDVVVHCFGKSERAFYALEQLWQDADAIHHHY